MCSILEDSNLQQSVPAEADYRSNLKYASFHTVAAALWWTERLNLLNELFLLDKCAVSEVTTSK